MMKKILLILVGLFVLQNTIYADSEKRIAFSQLPTAAQQTVKNHFGKKQISVTKQEGTLKKSYEIMFADGDKIEFDSKGAWKEIKCRKASVPSALVPKAIATYIKKQYPKSRIREIEREGKQTEIKLSNGLDLKFDSKDRLIDIEK